MRLIGLLIVVLIIAWLLRTQLAIDTVPTSDLPASSVDVPVVPATPQQLDSFDRQINEFVTDAAAERARQIEHNSQ